MKCIYKIFIFFIMFIVLLAIYATFIERNLFLIERHDILINEKKNNNLKIVHFTDVQLGDFYNLNQLNKVVYKINKLNPDIVVFTGDLIDNAYKYNEIDSISDVLINIKSNIGKYAIYGNHDYGGGAERYYKNIMNKSGFTVLKNSSISINFNDKILNIFGSDDGLIGKPDIKKTMKGIKDENINIILMHEPDLIDRYQEYPIDLAFAGHSHGGQVYIPFYGPIVNNKLSEKYVKGFYRLKNQRNTLIYVNTGLGNTRLPFRFFNIPKVVLFNMYI